MNRCILAAAAAAATIMISTQAMACSLPSKMPTMAERFAAADSIFIGSLRKLSRDDLHQGAAYEVTVIESVKGEASGTLHYFSHLSSAACGFELENGTYVFGQTPAQIRIAKGEASDHWAGQAGKYGAGLFVLGAQGRHGGVEDARAAALGYASSGR